MGSHNRIRSTDKNIEGKVLEGIGDLRGDRQTQAQEKRERKELKTSHADADLNDETKENT